MNNKILLIIVTALAQIIAAAGGPALPNCPGSCEDKVPKKDKKPKPDEDEDEDEGDDEEDTKEKTKEKSKGKGAKEKGSKEKSKKDDDEDEDEDDVEAVRTKTLELASEILEKDPDEKANIVSMLGKFGAKSISKCPDDKIPALAAKIKKLHASVCGD